MAAQPVIFHQMPLRQKMLVLVVVTSALALVTAFGLFMLYHSSSVYKTKMRELEMHAKVIGAMSDSALIYYDEPLAKQNLETLASIPDVVLACLYEEDKLLLASYQRTIEEQCPRSFPAYGAHFDDNALYYHQPILVDEIRIGSLYIESNLKDIKHYFTTFLLYAMMSIVVGTLVAGIISLRMMRMVTQPISQLLRIAKRVSHHYDYSIRAQKTTQDELGTLVDAFNHMLDEVQKRDDTMEQRVHERTKQLEAARQAAVEANQAKTVFLTNMSHELRTPMHAILSYADFGIEELAQGELDELSHYFQRIHASGDRLLSLLNNLLDLSKLESGKMHFKFEQEDMRIPLDVVVKELQVLLDQKHLTLEMPAFAFEPVATFDHGKLVQVLYNILANAIKFSPEGGKITMQFTQTTLSWHDQLHDAIAFSISDEGIGIPEKELHKVFNPFVQSSNTTTGAGGTGLGLAICQEIVRRHHGTIVCRNNASAGAIFTVTLPVERIKAEKGGTRG